MNKKGNSAVVLAVWVILLSLVAGILELGWTYKLSYAHRTYQISTRENMISLGNLAKEYCKNNIVNCSTTEPGYKSPAEMGNQFFSNEFNDVHHTIYDSTKAVMSNVTSLISNSNISDKTLETEIKNELQVYSNIRVEYTCNPEIASIEFKDNHAVINVKDYVVEINMSRGNSACKTSFKVSNEKIICIWNGLNEYSFTSVANISNEKIIYEK